MWLECRRSLGMASGVSRSCQKLWCKNWWGMWLGMVQSLQGYAVEWMLEL